MDHLERYKDVFDSLESVVRNAEVHFGGRTIRIEIMRGYTNPNMPYTASYSELERFVGQNPDMTNGKFDKAPEEMFFWRQLVNFPWVSKSDPDDAMAEALHWVSSGLNTGRSPAPL